MTFNYSGLDVPTSLQESFGLVCDREVYVKLHGSLYFLGLCLGSLIGGYVSDRLGRAKWLSISHFSITVLGIIMAVTEYLWLHLLSWCLISALCMSTWIASTAYNAETSKLAERHIYVGILNTIFSASMFFSNYFFSNHTFSLRFPKLEAFDSLNFCNYFFLFYFVAFCRRKPKMVVYAKTFRRSLTSYEKSVQIYRSSSSSKIHRSGRIVETNWLTLKINISTIADGFEKPFGPK